MEDQEFANIKLLDKPNKAELVAVLQLVIALVRTPVDFSEVLKAVQKVTKLSEKECVGFVDYAFLILASEKNVSTR